MADANEPGSNQLLAAAKNLPYRKWWFWLILLILIRVVVMSYESSRPVTYDPVALGFSSEEAMNSAFAKGYHTRQKMEEMARFHAEVPSRSNSASAEVAPQRDFSPSFDCSKANSTVNDLICSDKELSALDVDLSQAYKDLLNSNNYDNGALKSDQLEWLKGMLNSCRDKVCIKSEYENRIGQIAALQAGD